MLFGSKKPKLIDLYAVFLGLQLLCESGQTLQYGLSELAKIQKNRMLGEALSRVAGKIKKGLSIGKAFRSEEVFPAMVAPSLEAGDRSGSMSKAFRSLAETAFIQNNLYSKISSVMLTPKIAVTLLLIIIIAYVKFAVPEYVKMFEENSMEIPRMLVIVSFIVNGFVDNWFISIPVLIGCFVGFKRLCMANLEKVDMFKLKVPIYGKLHFSFIQHQFVSVMQLMLTSGLTVPAALDQACKTVGNTVVAEAIRRVHKDVSAGYDLSAALQKNNKDNVFDDILISCVKAGERSGSLASVMGSLCAYYAKALTDMVEPVGTKLTFIMIIPIGFVIVGMFVFTIVPMFDFMSKMSGG